MYRLIFKLFLAIGISANPLVSPSANAQEVQFPPLINLVVPFAPGAGTDTLARAVATQLSARIGSTVIVENRVGAGGLIGAAAVAKGPRDGSMLLFHSSSLITSAATTRKMQFDLSSDLVPLAIVAEGPMLVGMSAKSGIKTPSELIAAARARPGGMTSSSAGVGSVGHMAAELLNKTAAIQMLHVPYKGATPALVDLAAGTVDMLIATNTTLGPQIKSGRVVPIAVTSPKPSLAFPGMPTMASSAPGYSFDIWYGVFAPAGIKASMVHRLNLEINSIAMTPQVRALLDVDGAVPVEMTSDELVTRVKTDYTNWKALASEKNIIAE